MRTLFGLLMAFALALSPALASATEPEEVPLFSQAELDQMLAPIALYPDQLLSQILMAATYPLEVVQAARFQRANPGLQGQGAVRAAEGHDWDPSVQSLLAFPNVLQQMDADLDWTERLGDAFLAQQRQVMDTVQALRNRALAAGSLHSNDKVRVVREREIIMLQPARTDLFYVPYYDPLAVYGSWWWPAYRPVSWGPWPGYGAASGYGSRVGFYWGSGTSLGVNFFFGSWDWPTHRVRVVPRAPFYYRRPPPVHHVWVHEYQHRRGHPYRHVTVEHHYIPQGAPPAYRHDHGDRRGTIDRQRDPDRTRMFRTHERHPPGTGVQTPRRDEPRDRHFGMQPQRIETPRQHMETRGQRIDAPERRIETQQRHMETRGQRIDTPERPIETRERPPVPHEPAAPAHERPGRSPDANGLNLHRNEGNPMTRGRGFQPMDRSHEARPAQPRRPYGGEALGRGRTDTESGGNGNERGGHTGFRSDEPAHRSEFRTGERGDRGGFRSGERGGRGEFRTGGDGERRHAPNR